MYSDDVEFQDALIKLASRVGYAGTYVLEEIKENIENSRFSAQREKIELAISQKYLYIYSEILREIENCGGSSSIFERLQEFWMWYDQAQSIFDKKLWEGADHTTLESKLYEFYSAALARLEGLRVI